MTYNLSDSTLFLTNNSHTSVGFSIQTYYMEISKCTKIIFCIIPMKHFPWDLAVQHDTASLVNIIDSDDETESINPCFLVYFI